MEAINLGKPRREVAPNSPVLEDLGRFMEGIAGGPIEASLSYTHWKCLKRSIGNLFADR
jgi:hypothetical protein